MIDEKILAGIETFIALKGKRIANAEAPAARAGFNGANEEESYPYRFCIRLIPL